MDKYHKNHLLYYTSLKCVCVCVCVCVRAFGWLAGYLNSSIVTSGLPSLDKISNSNSIAQSLCLSESD